MDESVCRIPIRGLVEFLLRGGDLDNRYSGRREADAMQAGSRLHRKLQGRMGAGYRPEVALKLRMELKDVVVSVEGRADGIWYDGGTAVVDEIKGTYRDVRRVEEPALVHLAQARCYAYIYARQQGLPVIRTRVIYANLDSEETKSFTEDYTYEELDGWFQGLLDEYGKWLAFSREWKECRTSSLKSLRFPYPYREGQQKLAVDVYRTILRKKRLFIQAPTGVGKTLSTLFPSLKAMGEGLCGKIFYLTARTITRTVAADTLELFREQGMRAKSLLLTAKEKLCICEEVDCNPDSCPYAKGHFDRINDAVYDLWTHGPDSCTREVVLEQAGKYKVCPFELSLDLALWVDVVVCDYNYVFDPNVYLKRFFGEGAKGEYLFLIDEAHNLVERGRSMYSAALCREELLEIGRKATGKSGALVKALEGCGRYLLTLKRECEQGYQRLTKVGGLQLHLEHLASKLDEFLEDFCQEELRRPLTELYFGIRRFLDICGRLDENYEIYTRIDQDGKFWFHLYCARPADNLRLCLDRGSSSIFFSATLLPVNYYKDLLTGDLEDYAVYAHSPFDPGHCLLLVGTDVSSRYATRGEKEYRRMAEYICRTVKSRKGNYLAFFPSYQLLDEVYRRCSVHTDILWLRQEPDMGEKEREDFLGQFEEEKEQGMVAFCVMGGIFSEGIDLPGGKLIGALVIGTGLPQMCLEREVLKAYFDRRGMDGFAYAYRYPGMNKVLQSAGRVIRTAKDQGVVLLLDERFRNREYKELFPREWQEHGYCRIDNVEERLERFWDGIRD